MPRKLRVAVVSRHEMTQAGLRQLIGAHRGRATVVEARGCALRPGAFDVMVYDLSSRDAADDELRQLIDTRTPVVVLRHGARADLAERLLAMGAADVISMDVSAGALAESIHRAATGLRAPPETRRVQAHELARVESGLTEREVAVLELIAAGLSNQQIAAELYVSINTVKSYVRTAYKRIGAETRSHAVIWALHHGLGSGTRPGVLRPDDRAAV